MYCSEDSKHIRQKFFPYAHEAIEAWNMKANKQTNADRIRSMTDTQLAVFLAASEGSSAFDNSGEAYNRWIEWLKQGVSK